MTLDCAQAEFLTAERAVISLKGGELYVLSLLADAQRCVRGFHFDRAAGSVLTTCLSVCHDNYLFLGSRLGKTLKVAFFTESAIRFSNLQISKIKIFQITILSLKFEFVVYCYWREI